MFPLKLIPFTLKAFAAIAIHSHKIDILNLRAERGSSLDSNISTFIVASCVACILSKVNLSPHLQSISDRLVFVLEMVLTVYGTEVAMYLIWLPFLKGLLSISTKLSQGFNKSRYKAPVDDVSNCVESDLFCYLNICLALFIASNTLASFDLMKNLKTLWPSTVPFKHPSMSTAKNVERKIPEYVHTQTVTNAMLPASTAAESGIGNRIRPKRRPILLMNLR